MRKLFFILTIILFQTNISFGQNNESENLNCKSFLDTLLNQTIFIHVDNPPRPEGGEENLIRRLAKEISIQPSYKNGPVGSKTIISFIVDEQGQIIGKSIERDDFEDTNVADQMFRVIESIEWIPGSCEDQIVPVKFVLPLHIGLK